ncbi:hypothetical protein P879_05011 [Paragonimus westermani]|uniref:Dynein heavy chain, axonemal n=1 Tax=Paragonimus westermani TaxID=34504 RepID=A0A8T0D5E8_9TREM|nr:hypothetical protein P879_05011 [Paragonimus westermani]
MGTMDVQLTGQIQHYKRLFSAFRAEMEDIAAAYTKHCDDPPLDRDMPPFAGRIAWARNYYLRLSQPMSLFWNQVPALRDSKDAYKTTARYNHLGEALVAYEILVYRNWKSQYMISHVNAVFKRITPDLEKLLAVRLYKFYRLYYRGFYEHDWYSSLVDQWIQEVEEELGSLEHLLNQAQDLLETHINEVIERISHYILIELPEPTDTQEADQALISDCDITYSEQILNQRSRSVGRISSLYRGPWKSSAWDVYDLVRVIHRRTVQGATQIQLMSQSVEEAANRYINMLAGDFYQHVQRFEQTEKSYREFDDQNDKDEPHCAAHNDDADKLNDGGGRSSLIDNQTASSLHRPAEVRIPFATTHGASEEERRQKLIAKIYATIDEQLRNFGQRTVDAVIKAVRTSLEEVWKHFGMREASGLLKDVPFGQKVNAGSVKPHPLIKCEVVFSGERLLLRPSLEEIQTAIRAINGCLLTCTKFIGKWTETHQRTERLLSPGLRGLMDRFSVAHVLPSKIDSANQLDGKKDPSLYDRSSIVLMHSASAFLGMSQRKVSGSQMDQSGTRNTVTDDKTTIGRRATGTSSLPKVSDTHELAEVEVNCFQDVRHDREVYRAQTMLVTWQNTMKKILFLTRGFIKELRTVTEPLEIFSSLWTTTPEGNMAQFLKEFENPGLAEFENKFQELKELGTKLEYLFELYIVGPLEVHTRIFRITTKKLLDEHKNIFTRKCIELFITQIQHMSTMIEDYDRTISRPISNLDDIFYAIDTLTKFHDREVSMDMMLVKAEDTQAMLNRYELELPQEHADLIEATRCALTRLADRAASTMNRINEAQQNFQKELIESSKQIRRTVQTFMADYHERGPMTPGLTQYEAFDRQLFFRSAHEQLMRKVESCARRERLFGLTPISMDGLRRIGQQLELLQCVYGLYSEVNRTLEMFAYIVWRDADMIGLQEKLTGFLHKCQHLPKSLKHWPAYFELSTKLTELVSKLPLLSMLRNSAMKPRHWEQIEALLGVNNLDPEATDVTVGTMLNLPISSSDGTLKDQVEEVCIGAAREKDIETRLNTVIVEWSQQDLELMPFKNRGNLLLREERMQEILQHLDESIYNLPFRSQIQNWVQSLSTTSETLGIWLRVQSLWVYLEAVFIGSDLAKQLPREAKSFHNIDRNWVRLMERAWDTPNVVTYCTADPSLQDLLPRLMEQLEVCQRSLSSYLECKRRLFPRFFFVSDSVLLEILGQSSEPRSVQKHLPAVFENTKYLSFSDDVMYDTIEAVFSSEDEELKLLVSVQCQGPVESWLSKLLMTIQSSIHELVRSSHITTNEDEFQLLPFLDQYPAQVGILGLQFLWTREAAYALDEVRYDPKIMQRTNKHYEQLLFQLIERTTLPLNTTERTKYETFIIIHLHQKEIFDELCKLGIRTSSDFEWIKQTRAEFREDLDKCVISITDVNFEYQNEFLGCTERLVITPLTDRCYITLAQALSLGFGGFPTGPTGTGKTETVKASFCLLVVLHCHCLSVRPGKDVGRCLGQYVVLFNCSEQMDFRGLARIFKGLVQSGVWGCFDDFNRLELPVLSVAAQQIAVVLQAKRDLKSSLVFSDGELVTVNPEFGIFITTNPDYAGRKRLPENLKISFRMVAMMVPDRQMIIRVKLAACGFVNNMSLARKFHCLNQLCEEQLTKQVHYDFGLRNVLTVLRTLGAYRRAHKTDSEEQVMMRVLRDMNLSKLVDQDEPLFLSMLDDLFPGVTSSTPGYNLDSIKLYEMQRVRHGVVILGPPGSGKSKGIAVLLRTLTERGQPHRELRMNPKAVTTAEMFGHLNAPTHDWTDGIFTTLWRRTMRLKSQEHCWIVLDGPVDAIWIENLNSVLDDNKTLTLANGDRIPMVPNCKVVFEVDSVDNASPATISRNGMVYISSGSLSWSPLFEAWVQTQTKCVRDAISSLVENIFPSLMKFLEMESANRVVYLEAFYIRQFCDLFSGMVDEHADDAKLVNIAVFCLIWSCGCLLDVDERIKMDHYLRKISPGTALPVGGGHQSSVFDFRRGFETFIERRVGSTYGPPGGKRLTVFIDDINMPVINEWGDQVVNELVRQLIEMGGVYSLDKLGEFLTVMDVQVSNVHLFNSLAGIS